MMVEAGAQETQYFEECDPLPFLTSFRGPKYCKQEHGIRHGSDVQSVVFPTESYSHKTADLVSFRKTIHL